MLSLTGPLAIGGPRLICRPLARLCEKAAKLQRLDLDKLKYDGIYALLGISEDGSVMALSWRDDAWLPTRAPVPSSVARAKELGLVKLGAQVPLQPVWARVNSQKLTVFRNGVEVEIWRTPTLARPVIKQRSLRGVREIPPGASPSPALSLLSQSLLPTQISLVPAPSNTLEWRKSGQLCTRSRADSLCEPLDPTTAISMRSGAVAKQLFKQPSPVGPEALPGTPATFSASSSLRARLFALSPVDWMHGRAEKEPRGR